MPDFDLPHELNVCCFCGGRSSFDNPLRWDTWHLPFVSEKFPAHPSCASDYFSEQMTDQELHEALR